MKGIFLKLYFKWQQFRNGFWKIFRCLWYRYLSRCNKVYSNLKEIINNSGFPKQKILSLRLYHRSIVQKNMSKRTFNKKLKWENSATKSMYMAVNCRMNNTFESRDNDFCVIPECLKWKVDLTSKIFSGNKFVHL